MAVVRLGCVSYLNTRPLVWGLEREPALKLDFHVPARLLEQLTGGRCDVVLAPIIDYQRVEGLALIHATCIGADGPVYTVRLYAKVPLREIRRLYADVESHTSVALCRVLLKEEFGIEPAFVEDPAADVDARLLIGDKVAREAPRDCQWEWDLAEAWKRRTGLPFVFAAWMTREGTEIGDLAWRLRQAREQGMTHVQEIVREEAARRGWPEETALTYLTRLLRFDLDLSENSPQRRAIELFFRRCRDAGILPQCRPIRVLG